MITNLSDHLDEHGITQAWLAQRAGVSRITVGNWAHGRTRPSTENARRVETILGVEAGTLFPNTYRPGGKPDDR